MSARPHISDEQRRARIALRHGLAPHTRFAGPTEVADGLVALHATDSSTIHLSIAARSERTTLAETTWALGEGRELLEALTTGRSESSTCGDPDSDTPGAYLPAADTNELLRGLMNHLRNGNVREAVANCDNKTGPVGEVIRTAIETGFDRAWTAILDANITTLIIAGVLFFLGSSLIKSFAVTLFAGVCCSMFTAVTVTRWLVTMVGNSRLGENRALFGDSTSQTE